MLNLPLKEFRTQENLTLIVEILDLLVKSKAKIIMKPRNYVKCHFCQSSENIFNDYIYNTSVPDCQHLYHKKCVSEKAIAIDQYLIQINS